MANQTISFGSSVNHDSAAVTGLANGETYTINGGSLTIDCDVRWGQNAAVPGGITLSSTQGGSLIIDGSKVWEVPYTSPTGNVPAFSALWSNPVTGDTSLATGEFFAIFTGAFAPVAAAAAIPASGTIKLRAKSGDFVSGEVIRLPGGATVLASGPGKRSWIHVVSTESTAISAYRLNTCTFTGDWYELGTTNGADDQTFAFPVQDLCPAIWVETDVGSNQYEPWLNAGSRWGGATVYVATDLRGKYFGQDASTGIITIARRVSNSCGYKPISGLRVRIPNIILSNTTSANYAANTRNATITSRKTFTASAGAPYIVKNVCSNWYMNFNGQYSLDMRDSAVTTTLIYQNAASSCYIENVGVGLDAAIINNPFLITNNYIGTTMLNCRGVRYSSAAAAAVFGMNDCLNVSLTNVSSEVFGNTSATTRGSASCFTYTFNRVTDGTLTNCSAVGGGTQFNSCINLNITGFKYADLAITDTNTTNPMYAFQLTAQCSNVTIDGFSNFGSLTNVHPRNGILNVQTSCADIKLQNIGSPTAPYNCGSANQTIYIVDASVSFRITVRRVYCINLGTRLAQIQSTCQDYYFDNVWGDGGDTHTIQGTNLTMRGLKATPNTAARAVTYGMHFEDGFLSTTVGRISCHFTEPTISTSPYVTSYFDPAGGGGYTSIGNVSLPTTADYVISETPYYIRGHTGLYSSAPTFIGTNTGNLSLQFQWDTGGGYNGSWLNINQTNLQSVPSIDPTGGIKLKFRAGVGTGNAANALTCIALNTSTNSGAHETQYDLPVIYITGQVSSIIPNSRIQIYNVDTASEIVNTISTGAIYSYPYVESGAFTNGDVVRIRLAYQSGTSAYKDFETFAVANAAGWSALASQQVDTVYNTIGVDGSTVTEFVTDYPNVQIDINDPDGTTNINRLYSWWTYIRATENGIRQWLNGLVAEDIGNFKINTDIIDLKLDNINTGGVLFNGGQRFYRSDGAIPVVNTTSGGGSIVLYSDKVYVVEVGTSGLTEGESENLNSILNNTKTIIGLTA